MAITIHSLSDVKHSRGYGGVRRQLCRRNHFEIDNNCLISNKIVSREKTHQMCVYTGSPAPEIGTLRALEYLLLAKGW